MHIILFRALIITIYYSYLRAIYNSITMRKSISTVSFQIRDNYDYSKSTEDNYSADSAPFVGKYKLERSELDYSYHKRYSEERQLMQDSIVDMFLKTIVRDKKTNVVCDIPLVISVYHRE